MSESPVHRSATVVDRALDATATVTREVARVALRTWMTLDVGGADHVPATGVARLAVATGAPVVPAGVTGSADAWPVDARPRPWRRARVRVRFGPPFAPPVDRPLDRRRWNDHLHEDLLALSGRPRTDELAPVGGRT